jgi:hypothetical protein
MHSILARFESSGFWLWEHLEAYVYVAPVDNEEMFHPSIFGCLSEYPQLPWHF